jgi:hypothetical protein
MAPSTLRAEAIATSRGLGARNVTARPFRGSRDGFQYYWTPQLPFWRNGEYTLLPAQAK